MEILNNGFGLLATVIGVVGLLGGAVGYFAKGRGDSIIQYQATELKLRDETIARLEKENTALISERDSLLREKQTLVKLAQGSPQLGKLTKEIKNLVKEVASLATKEVKK